jgi:two-component system, NarL family, sensor histidine kinase BarA
MDLLLHMSHEIRNPLTAIQGFLYIFSKSELNQRQADMLGSIRLSSEMLLQTLNDTLDAAKMESAELRINEEPFNPDFILRETIESMTFSATKKALNLHYEFEGNRDLNLLGDSFRLRQIMNNLLSNAIKYTKTGSITVKAGVMLFDGVYRLKVDVIDTGEGISQEQQNNLFSKYYQTNSSKGKLGTGLGLYICRELILRQKGDIKVKSEAGKGSTFSFFIPYTESAARREKTSQSTSTPVALLNGISILAVDDNDLNLLFLKAMTGKWNVKFHQAGNGKEALDILNHEKIDVVVTDLEMPEMDGHELIDAIRKLKKPLNKLPVIIMTGSGVPAVTAKGKKEQAGIIGKPFTEAELVKQVVGALRL